MVKLSRSFMNSTAKTFNHGFLHPHLLRHLPLLSQNRNPSLSPNRSLIQLLNQSQMLSRLRSQIRLILIHSLNQNQTMRQILPQILILMINRSLRLIMRQILLLSLSQLQILTHSQNLSPIPSLILNLSLIQPHNLNLTQTLLSQILNPMIILTLYHNLIPLQMIRSLILNPSLNPSPSLNLNQIHNLILPLIQHQNQHLILLTLMTTQPTKKKTKQSLT